MTDDLLARARSWASEDPDEQTRAELEALVERATSDDSARADLADRFDGRLRPATLIDLAQIADGHETDEPIAGDDRDRAKVHREHEIADDLTDHRTRRGRLEVRRHERSHLRAAHNGGDPLLLERRARCVPEEVGDETKPEPGDLMENDDLIETNAPNASATTCPPRAAMVVALVRSPVIAQMADRRTRPPSRGNPGIMLKAAR